MSLIDVNLELLLLLDPMATVSKGDFNTPRQEQYCFSFISNLGVWWGRGCRVRMINCGFMLARFTRDVALFTRDAVLGESC